ncbi:MAG: ferrous iron transporter B [Turicibacter sp.]|nr:ferrous iron transporter B [Turicibacter sp.]
MKIALTGNPNSGKTTLFNALTGQVEKIGNWSGVTIDKKEAPVRKKWVAGNEEIIAVDLPGAYSMSPFTAEETITRDFVQQENPDVIVNIVDATNLSRSLFFSTQLLELGIPVVVALNKCDLNRKKGISISVEALSYNLGCPIIETIATSKGHNGLKGLLEFAILSKGKSQKAPFDSSEVDISNKEAVEASDKKRYEWVQGIIAEVERRKVTANKQTKQDAVDRVVAHKWLGFPIFALIMWTVFSISQSSVGPFFADTLVGWIDGFYAWVEGLLGGGIAPVLRVILLDGIIGGVGAVVGFLPLIIVLFFLLSLLEDCGYMARVAVVMDKFFKRVGLSGKSIIPMVIGTGCSIPGIMSTRTIKNVRQRRTTAMLTPFMPCGAKLPVIALFAGVFFNEAAWVGTTMYFVGIFLIVTGAFIVVRITGERGSRAYFIMELPEYRFPSIKRAAVESFLQAKAFILKAGTIILLCNATIQLMQTFDWNLNVVADGAQSTSILASLATPFALLLVPLGFGAWQLAAAAITGFIAKENVVGTLAVVYGITNFINTDELALISGGDSVAGIMGLTKVAALSYLMFNLFTPPCFAALGAMNAELENKKWLWGAIGFQFGMGYIVAFLTYQIGTLVTTGALGAGFIPGMIAVLLIGGYITYLMIKGERLAYAKKKALA